MWLVELRETRILKQHRPELVEFVYAALLFQEGCYQVYDMLMHPKIDGVTDVG